MIDLVQPYSGPFAVADILWLLSAGRVRSRYKVPFAPIAAQSKPASLSQIADFTRTMM